MKKYFGNDRAFTINAIIVTLMLFALGCSKPKVTGIVVDNNNKPIPNAKISVKGTQFKSLTDNDGKYSIEYIPGKISLLFEKKGYTKNNIVIDIATEAEFPADTVRLTKFPGEEEIAGIVASNKVQTRSIYVGNLLYRYEDWNAHPGVDICGSPCDADIGLINSYKPLVDQDLINIKEYDFKQPSGFAYNLKKYFTISLTEKGEKFSVGGTYITKAPCETCWNWIVEGEKYYAINVKVCDFVFDKIEMVTDNYENNTSQIEYIVKTENTTPWGSFWAVADGQKSTHVVSFYLNDNKWNYNY
ncbi:MAG: carboxypeptidase-like regulatory domain-containing protein [Ignavibacteriaceae bacterium]